jgi:hypothetical protein
MKVKVLTEVAVCFEVDLPKEVVDECDTELFQAAWNELDKLIEQSNLPFEMDTSGYEIYEVRYAATDEEIYHG